MATSQIPLDSVNPNYTVAFTIPDNGVTYVAAVRWNARAGFWVFDLQDNTGDPIFSGCPILLGVNFGDRSTDPRMPPGIFYASDLSGLGVDAGINDLGGRVVVYFKPIADIIAGV